MDTVLLSVCALAPVALMTLAALLALAERVSVVAQWRVFQALSSAALVSTGISVWMGRSGIRLLDGLQPSSLGMILAVLVQLLGTVIGGFSARYLEGEECQRRYVKAFAAVLAGVHLLLMADHWVVLIVAWALVGGALQHLLCFYPHRPFARLAAHKKWIIDRVADGLLVGAGALAWTELGSGSLSDLEKHVGQEAMSTALQLSALGLVLAVVLRTALLPVHGWLIQVMEAPTPVSALLHAGVVNLGGFVLIRFAPLLERAMPARAVLLLFGLSTAVLAGMVMLTRISIKVRLAWSTVAQMGFMLVECALGLYTLAAVHIIGHSLYKAHAFLSASGVVRETRLRALHTPSPPTVDSLFVAPILALSVVVLMQSASDQVPWPWWWSMLLGVAWSPLLWLPAALDTLLARGAQTLRGILMVAALTGAALLAHALPLGTQDNAQQAFGPVALLGMSALYFCLTLLQLRPHWLSTWRRWSYAGFFLDEALTRLVLQLWPARWTHESTRTVVGPFEFESVAGALIDSRDELDEGRST